MTSTETTTTAATLTLADLNAATRKELTWDQYTLEQTFGVGKAGTQNRGRGTQGAKLHLLRLQTVIAETGEHKPGTFKVGQAAGIRGACASNGQFTGMVIKGYDLDAITCTKCLKRLAVLKALVPSTQVAK